jgi:hypothetical protein
MKKNEAMNTLYRIQSELGCKEFPGDPMLVNIFIALEKLKAKASKFDDLADLVVDLQTSMISPINVDPMINIDYRRSIMQKIIDFKTTY